MLDAHQLNVFLVAAETLNFTLAARRLHMSQPSVSQHIQSLEQHFGVPLFIRSGRHLRLTDTGAALLPMARQMVTLSSRIDETVRSLQGEVYGHLIVGCSTTPGKYVLPHLLANFHRKHPKVKVTCQVTSRQVALQMLCDGIAHLALASASEFCKDVEFRKFISEPVVLITPLDHPWAQRGAIEPDELLEADFIMREEGSGTYEAVRQGLAGVGIPVGQLQTILTLGNSEAIALAVQEGLGVGFVSQMVVSRLVHEGVARVKVGGLSLQQDIYIGRHMRHPAAVAQTAFWEFANLPENQTLGLPRADGANALANGEHRG
jgi:DNA-binding transcriptional LysR family regulator